MNLIKGKMGKLLSCILVLIILAYRAAAQRYKDLEEGYVPMFNGVNWDNWGMVLHNGDSEIAEKVFAIENGMIHVVRDTPDSLFLNNGTNDAHGVIFNKESFNKYILHFEYKWREMIADNFDQFQYDAGLYYQVYEERIWPKGIEYQIRYDHINNKNHTGDFWATHVLSRIGGRMKMMHTLDRTKGILGFQSETVEIFHRNIMTKSGIYPVKIHT